MKQILIVFLWMLSLWGLAQETHVIEPSILEVSYEVTHEKDKDMFALRCGKNVSQYFSINKLRDDSLRASPDPSMRNIVLDEMLEAAMHRDDPSKQRPDSPGHGDYLYWNLTEGEVSVYTRVFGNKVYVDIEIAADGNTTLSKSHETAERVHDIIESDFPEVKHVMVHVNPYNENK